MNPLNNTLSTKRSIPEDWNDNNPIKKPKQKNPLSLEVNELASNTINMGAGAAGGTQALTEIKATKFTNDTDIEYLPPLWHSAKNKDWDAFNEQLDNASLEDINACPLTGPDKGITPLAYAAIDKQWGLVKKILELHPKANLDLSFTIMVEAAEHNLTLLWIVILEKQWDIAKAMLELNPNLNFDLSITRRPIKGMTLFWLLVSWQQWDLAKKILELNPNVNLNTYPVEGPSKGLTSLWFAAIWQQWDLVKKMLELNPRSDLNVCPEGGPNKDKTLKDFAGNSNMALNQIPYLHTVISYLILLGINTDGTAWQMRKNSIFGMFDRIVASFNDPWNNPLGKPFQDLPEELIMCLVREVINLEHPELNEFPASVLYEKINAHAALIHKANHTKAIKNTATLAFNEFRWENGLSTENYTKAEIKDFHRMIATCLEELHEQEFKQKNLQYTSEKREQIVKEIGRDQNIKTPRLKKSYVIEAIRKVMTPPPLQVGGEDS